MTVLNAISLASPYSVERSTNHDLEVESLDFHLPAARTEPPCLSSRTLTIESGLEQQSISKVSREFIPLGKRKDGSKSTRLGSPLIPRKTSKNLPPNPFKITQD